MMSGPAELSKFRHDLRSPLGQIVGFTEMLIEGAEGSGSITLLELLRALQQRANDTLRLINDSFATSPVLSAATACHLSDALRQAAQTIHQIVESLTSASDAQPTETFHDDLQRIAAAATELERLAGHGLLVVARSSPRSFDPQLLSPSHSAESVPKGKDTTTSTTGPTEHGTILVVDDSVENREILCRRLAPLGYELSVAADGQAALERVAAGPVDLLLLDIVMPGLDGFEVLQRLKANPATQNIPVLMLSAIDEMDAVVRCIELGADDYLPKPFPTPLLRARVKACLANKRISDQLRKYTEWLFGPALFKQAVASPQSFSLKQQERSVLFADIRGFTRWTERHEPEQVVAMLNAYFETAERILAHSPVIKTEYTGDEIMSVFPEALSAVQISIRFQREIGAALKPLGLGMGVGVHCGPLIEGLMGSAEVKAYCFVGDTINTARRICDHARTGQILVTKNVFSAGASQFEAATAKSFKAKGKRGLLEVFELPWAAAEASKLEESRRSITA